MKKVSKFALALLPILAMTPFLASCVSVSGGSSFIYSNFESYMSPDVEIALNEKYGVDFISYPTNDQIYQLLKNNEVEIVTPSGYEAVSLIEDNLIQKMDWNKFNIPGITNSEEAKTLFTPETVIAMTSFTDKTNKPINLLDYGVPYFAQDFVFAYRGPKIPSLHALDINWKTTLDIVSREPRFNATIQNSRQPLLWAIDDERTLYSIPRLIETNSTNLNPQPNASISELTTTYKHLIDILAPMGKRNFQLKSDSNVVLNALADRQAMGALLYNGDAFFAAYGGDSGVEIPEGDFHIVKPKNSVVAVEIVAIDNEVVGEKLDKSYDVIKEVNFPITTGAEVIEDTLAYQNFDYVTYTPTNKELYDYVLANYFDLTLPVDKLAKEIFLIENIKKSQLENPISKMVKSNLFYTYSTYFKDNI